MATKLLYNGESRKQMSPERVCLNWQTDQSRAGLMFMMVKMADRVLYRGTSASLLIELASTSFLRQFCLLLLIASLSSSSTAQNASSPSVPCPLNFTVLSQFPYIPSTLKSDIDSDHKCLVVNSGLQAVVAIYLRQTGFFLVPKGSAISCMEDYKAELASQGSVNFNISASCDLNFLTSERGSDLCENIQTAADYKRSVSSADFDNLNASCSPSLEMDVPCGTCSLAIASTSVGRNRTSGNYNCIDFTKVYAIGVLNVLGPLDPGTLLCVLFIPTNTGGRGKGVRTYLYVLAGVLGTSILICIGIVSYCCYLRRFSVRREERNTLSSSSVPTSSINWFTMDELKGATRNFSRDSILGSGGFGNVYKGVLRDGSEVAVKRFKNCSPAGDADFVHEVEMISSVRHKYLVAIRGLCVESTGVMDGHQRMIVYDYMPNGSLQDHLFSSKKSNNALDWPARKTIALDVAKGLEYLHHHILPAIFHRDIKASNILLDEDFHARLADFGLAKFTPEGVSHLSTSPAGTKGYVAPEYALRGFLSEKSDVYSFGMVLLELITGRKALSTSSDDPPFTLVSDWAWPAVRRGDWESILDARILETLGPDDEMKRFIFVALLCAHPDVDNRPSIDQAMKMLENTDLVLPKIPERPPRLNSRNMQSREKGKGTLQSEAGRSSVSGDGGLDDALRSEKWMSEAGPSYLSGNDGVDDALSEKRMSEAGPSSVSGNDGVDDALSQKRGSETGPSSVSGNGGVDYVVSEKRMSEAGPSSPSGNDGIDDALSEKQVLEAGPSSPSGNDGVDDALSEKQVSEAGPSSVSGNGGVDDVPSEKDAREVILS